MICTRYIVPLFEDFCYKIIKNGKIFFLSENLCILIWSKFVQICWLYFKNSTDFNVEFPTLVRFWYIVLTLTHAQAKYICKKSTSFLSRDRLVSSTNNGNFNQSQYSVTVNIANLCCHWLKPDFKIQIHNLKQSLSFFKIT